jgi:hypothetical protein
MNHADGIIHCRGHKQRGSGFKSTEDSRKMARVVTPQQEGVDLHTPL